MDIYFYCTYENSGRGYYPTYFDGTGLREADGNSGIDMPQTVKDFFFYDRFKLLWRYYVNSCSLFSENGYEFFGIRNVKGNIGKTGTERTATVNAVFLAGKKESDLLRRIALYAIGNYPSFALDITSMLTVDRDKGYDIDGAAFISWITRKKNILNEAYTQHDEATQLLNVLMDKKQISFMHIGLLKFAVCTESWENIQPSMGKGFSVNKKPREAISYGEYERIFLSRSGFDSE